MKVGGVGAIYSFAVENGKIYVSWVSLDVGSQGCILDADFNINFKYYNGTKWKSEEKITTGSGVEVHHGNALVVEDGKAYLAWMQLNISWPMQYFPDCEYSTVPINRNATYYSYFDGEKWWTPEEIRSGNNDKSRLYPSVAVENGIVYAVWMEEADNDWEFHVYFSKEVPSSQPLPILEILIGGTITITGAVAAGVISGTEIGKYSFLSFFLVPLYTRQIGRAHV